MAKVVVTSLKSKTKGGRAETSVSEKRVRDSNGRLKTLRTLDVNSPTFGNDLRHVFGKNVAKARRDNKRVTGSTDVVPRKG